MPKSKTSSEFDQVLARVLTQADRQAARESIDTFGYSKPGKKEYLQRLEKFLAGLPVVRLTLAFDPSREIQQGWVAWLRSRVHPQMVIDCRVDPAVVGGAIIEYDGQAVDFSLRGKLDQLADKELAL